VDSRSAPVGVQGFESLPSHSRSERTGGAWCAVRIRTLEVAARTDRAKRDRTPGTSSSGSNPFPRIERFLPVRTYERVGVKAPEGSSKRGSASPSKTDCYHRFIGLSRSHPLSASEGEGAEASTGAGLPRPVVAPECPEGATEATRAERGLAPDRAARAHRPTPQGEGGTRKGGQR